MRFVYFRDRQLRSGNIMAFKDTRAMALELGTKRTWKIPNFSMQGSMTADCDNEAAPYVPPPEPATTAIKARLFQQGDTATFEDHDGRAVTGVVVHVNQRTETRGTSDGGPRRVPFHLLRHVLDI